MEKLTQAEKAQFENGMREATAQAGDVYKTVAVLRAIGDDIPAGTRINGEDIKALVVDLERRGIVLPSTGISAMEVRSLRDKVAKELPRISLRGIPMKSKVKGQTPAMYDSSDSLKMKARMQEQQFNLLLAMEGDSQEKLEARLEEAADPLMRVVNRNKKK